MKICIIGGGFYGCHLAKKITNFGHTVDLYEKNKDILQEAINNNQHRLHLGFHYPRCSTTIEQAKRSFKKFLNEYGDCVDDIKDNFYVIEKSSYVNFTDYKKKFINHSLDFEEVNKNMLSDYFTNLDNIEGVVKVGEKKINLLKITNKLRKEIYENKNINLILNSKIEHISDDSIIFTKSFEKKYDFIINATYSNPSLGMRSNALHTKNELCFLVLAKLSDKKFTDKAFTIMDGQYVSLYPADYEDMFTISSVTYTPFVQSLDIDKIERHKQNDLSQICKDASDKIIEHFRSFININSSDIKIVKNYISSKTKILNDINDFRASYYLRNNNNISLMCGKISAILDLEDSLMKEIKA